MSEYLEHLQTLLLKEVAWNDLVFEWTKTSF